MSRKKGNYPLGIGQFSKYAVVSVKTLRYYDKIQLLTPAKIDPDTGYRYYNDNQLPKMLLDSTVKRYGFSLDEVKAILSCDDRCTLSRKLARQVQRLRQQVANTEYVITELEQHLLNLERTGNLMSYQNNYTIQLVNTEPISAISCRQTMSVNEFGRYYGTLYEENCQRATSPEGFGHSTTTREFNPECSDIELAVSIAEPDQATTA